MSEIKCPNCGESFIIDESGYAKILQQVRNDEFERELEIRKAELERIQNRLSSNLGTKVIISQGAKKGKIEIEYYGNEDLERLLNIIENN